MTYVISGRKSREKRGEKSREKKLKARKKSREEKSSTKFVWHLLSSVLRIDYKILLLTFKCIYGQAPTCLSDLISIKSNSLYNLRSTGKLLLDYPKGKMLTTLGARSFSAAAPKLWNELPVELRQATSLDSFKSRLKTYFFKKYFL